ncbi:lysine N(6)-hydroxylase/L-ornithine N(5)-oxygenase family protein [Reichenbachiella versicolor]|uniref:lysine N(6)-hydroxylase/L-ornithine N(5)-oxygenase family protein n=1 Tax=Reichenbachiella versicolor TaxID=1821036 RepID=UPI000D6E5C82|nr:lysine N(6)-hydroxylase/L-ornithine N(5)-oxygenase family protein [Reichenbachiella versicolor]
MNNKIEILDYAAVGLGPFNLGMACLSENIDSLNGVYLERQSSFDWHPGMLLQDTTLQIPFMADLVTLADPTNRFSFMNYIKSQGRIYSFYIKEDFYLLRNEYNQYCQWAIKQLDNIHFDTEVVNIDYLNDEEVYLITCKSVEENTRIFYKAKKLVFGTGTTPSVPSCAKPFKDEISHTSQYLYKKSDLQKQKSITIVGGGQSAAEIFYDLLQDIDQYNYQLNWITRSPRYFPLEYSKLTLEMTSPEYVDYFHALDADKRDQLIADQKNLYKGINQDLINDIFDLLYTKNLKGNVKAQLRTNSELKQMKKHESGSFELIFHQNEVDKYFLHKTEVIVMATGYKSQIPEFLDGIKDRIKWDTKGRFDVNRNYSIDINGNEIFVQNAELHTHGFVTPDLGMGAYRNTHILNSILGKEHFCLEQRIAFQQFEVTADEEVFIENPMIAE